MKLNLHPILEASRAFYKTHGLPVWATELPVEPTIGDDDAERSIWAEKHGWTEAFAFPAFAQQMADFETLVHETARKRALHLSDDQQYDREPQLADAWTRSSNGRVVQRQESLGQRMQRPYLLVFSPEPLVNGWGRNGKQLVALLESKGLHGLTAPEYLVLQRHLCERDRHHLFYRGEETERRGHCLWLVDSANEERMTVASWDLGGVSLQACPLSHRESKRATLTGIVVPL